MTKHRRHLAVNHAADARAAVAAPATWALSTSNRVMDGPLAERAPLWRAVCE